MSPRGVALVALEPRWLEWPGDRGRYGIGISLRCPTHGGDCRLSLYFRHPFDGFPPIPGVPLVHYIGPREDEGQFLPEVTIYGEGHDHLIHVPGHWHGWVFEGQVHSSSPRAISQDDIPTDPMIPALSPGEDA